MEKEKKEIKISLWTFYVLVAAIVVLVGAVVIGGMGVARKNQLPQNTDNKSENIILYNGYELKVRYDEEIILEDMEYTSENIEKYEKSYYNYENRKYIGITNGIVEESYDGYCAVSNVSKFAFSKQYNAKPRNVSVESNFECAYGTEYQNKEALIMDLDGDGKNEYIVALSSNDYPHKSEITILDYNLNKIETLVKRDKGHWTHASGEEEDIIVLSIEDIEIIDLDNDNIMEIVVDTWTWDFNSVLIYKYENREVKGVTNFHDEATI